MKILHTADWHLGKKLYHIDRIEEQKEVLEEIIDIANSENVDIIIVAGDLFDTINPSNEATELLYSTLKKLSNNTLRPVIAIAGNHDSADRINVPNILARECGIILIGYPNEIYKPFKQENWAITDSGIGWINIKFKNGESTHITTTAFTNEIRLKQFISDDSEEKGLIDYLSKHWTNISKEYHQEKSFNLLIGHLLIWPENSILLPEEEDGEKSINLGNTSIIPVSSIPDTYDYVALGHLHRHQEIKHTSPVFYSGSPIAYSFSENNQTKYLNIINVEEGKLINIEKIKLNKGKKLLTNTLNSLHEAKEWVKKNHNHHLEIQLKVDEFMSAEDTKDLRSLTTNLLNIIPIIREDNSTIPEEEFKMNNFSDLTETFKSFFLSEKGIPPNDEILQIFKEIINSSEE